MRHFLSGMGLVLAVLVLGGCATPNPRFETVTPSSQITGEARCEPPQHWKALALEGVDTRSLTQASVVQIRIPAEWIGDALGWFVEGDDSHTLQHYPRYTWQALVIDERTGKQQWFSAIMKNPLTSPYLTVLITDPNIRAGQEVQVYVPSGAYTKLLTTAGDRLRLPSGKDCLGLVDAAFVRSFPSRAVTSQAPAQLLASIRADFSKPSLQSDGKVYSLNPLVLNRHAIGDLRQVTKGERLMENGATVAVSPVSPWPTVISLGVAAGSYFLSKERYVGPFGERMYSSLEAQAALGRITRNYNVLKHELERRAGVSRSRDLSIHLDFSGHKAGWEIGEMIALQVEAAWAMLDRLEGRVVHRQK